MAFWGINWWAKPSSERTQHTRFPWASCPTLLTPGGHQPSAGPEATGTRPLNGGHRCLPSDYWVSKSSSKDVHILKGPPLPTACPCASWGIQETQRVPLNPRELAWVKGVGDDSGNRALYNLDGKEVGGAAYGQDGVLDSQDLQNVDPCRGGVTSVLLIILIPHLEQSQAYRASPKTTVHWLTCSPWRLATKLSLLRGSALWNEASVTISFNSKKWTRQATVKNRWEHV